MDFKLNILILEPYYGGSHRAFVDTFMRYSRHNCKLISMPARKWKWRMRGAAIHFAESITETAYSDVDIVFTCDMLSVADLRALTLDRLNGVPIVCYFHENQLTYPLSPDDVQDYQYAITNITSGLASDAVWFNSAFHMNEFLSAARNLLEKMPDYVPHWAIDRIKSISEVHPPPVDVSGMTQRLADETPRSLRILWPHRWEYDKNPEAFFRALIELQKHGLEFQLVVVGEQFRKAPQVFSDAWPEIEKHIVHAGYLESHADYLKMIAGCDLVVSTAIQENFGIAIVEAIMCGCQPLLPNRLAYPEVISSTAHETCLYDTDEELVDKLVAACKHGGPLPGSSGESILGVDGSGFEANRLVSIMDDRLCEIAKR